MVRGFDETARIAYFSMEIALRSDIPTYAGGLGVLAGDTMRSAADLALPLVAVSLVSRAGYFAQTIDADGHQVERPDPWEPERWAKPLDAKVALALEDRQVWVRAWLYVIEGNLGGRAPVILLDTDVAENHADDRMITHYLYGGDAAYRLKQEAVLGIGGVRMLHALGFRVRQYHLNEGHSALLGLELLRRFAHSADEAGVGPRYDIGRVRALCNFTTHTPIDAGHDRFGYDLVARILGEPIEFEELRRLAGADALNMTRLALNLSEYVNGVAKRHAELSARMFPGYRVHAITNGVHPYTWTCPSFAELYDRHLPHWCHEPEILVRADRIADDAIWQAHASAKRALIDRVQAISGQVLDPALPLIAFARRMTAYKRPDLLFSDAARLRSIARVHPFQVVIAGKAHPHDDPGKRLIAEMHRHAQELEGATEVVFMPGYDMELARLMTSGCDVWLNTPQPPLEASGTSGMKAAFNGVPSLSVLDGWWVEGCIEGLTGWSIGAAGDDASQHAAALYDKLEDAVLPLYYAERGGWVALMKGAISKNAYFFNSHRMMRRYATEAYLR
jgi:starch phosphorylase